jgi:hypothetical protein
MLRKVLRVRRDGVDLVVDATKCAAGSSHGVRVAFRLGWVRRGYVYLALRFGALVECFFGRRSTQGPVKRDG